MKIMKTRISLESKDLRKLQETFTHFIYLFEKGNDEQNEKFFRESFLKGNRDMLGFPVSQEDKDRFFQKHKEHIESLEDFVHTIVEFEINRKTGDRRHDL